MSSGEFDHLKDWIDVQEETKETLKHGLLAFLNEIGKSGSSSVQNDRNQSVDNTT